MAAEKLGPRTYRIDPAGPAGAGPVDIFGRGREGGDAVTTIQWPHAHRRATARERRPEVPPYWPITTAHSDSYGVEVYVRDLDRLDSPGAAQVTVTGGGEKR